MLIEKRSHMSPTEAVVTAAARAEELEAKDGDA